MEIDFDLEGHCFENQALLSPHAARLRGKAYTLWLAEWQKIYKKLGSEKLPGAEDFLGYDLVNCLAYKDEIVGMTGHRFINLNDEVSYNTEFVQSLGTNFTEKITALGVTTFMTFESFLVNPKFRKTNFPLPLSRMLFYLTNLLYDKTPAHAIVGAARVDLRVPDLATSLGYETIEAGKKFRVFTCDLMLQRNHNVNHVDDKACRAARNLWSSFNFHRNEPYLSTANVLDLTAKAA